MIKKDERLGFDPLSWMNEAKVEKNPKKTNLLKQTADADTKSELKQDEEDVQWEQQDKNMKQILQDSLDLLAPQAESISSEFYELLFKDYPQVKPLFAKTDMSAQGKMLMAAIKMVVKNADKPDALEKALSSMGKKHQSYGALPEHYPAVAQTLLTVLAEHAQDAWTDELQQTWSDALNLVAEKMLAAYEVEEKKMVARKSVANSNSRAANSEIQQQMAHIKGIVDAMTAAVMMVDLDLTIVYMNPAAKKLMKSVEYIIRKTFPSFDASNLIGVCIDDFHKNPSHQRRLLSDPKNLPYQGMVVLDDHQFGLNVTPVYDEKGEFIGACQEWTDETQNIKNSIGNNRQKSALDGALTATMMCDQDLTITYMNDAVTNLLRRREAELRQVLPGFNVNTLIGSNIDQFHQNPSHQRALLSDPSRLPYQTTIQILDMHFNLNVTYLASEKGEYLGNCVEWRDVTDEKRAEKEVNALIQSASSGVLDQRLDADKYEGFLSTLGHGINDMLDTMVAPVKEAIEVAGALQQGKLTRKIEGNFEGAFADLQNSFNRSVDNLSKMVGEIRSASSQIASAAGEISQGNTDLSQRTEEQASSLEETASSMEELTSTVKQNADNSRQANLLAAGARKEAEAGGKVIDSTIEAMTEINSASNKIEDIISVIDEIAFQTNLLALNAAVEAARAGEQGRGFAVVASEVRSLAQRSAAAAKEIKVLIKDSVEKVDEGSRLVDESGRTLSGIVNSVKKVSDIIAEIAAASAEQSAGIDQVGKAITQLDEVTQQNAALVEEAAAASESMDEQAKNLNTNMSFFDTGDTVHVVQEKAVLTAAKPASTPVQPRIKPTAPARTSPASADEWEEF